MRRKQFFGMLLAFGLCLPLFCFTPAQAAAVDFTPDPQTAYAASFIEACEGQQWFLNEVERLLNMEQKTLDMVSSQDDFSGIRSLSLRDKNIAGHIPKAIGELTELQYLFLSDNQLSGEIPAELFLLSGLKNIDLSGNQYEGNIPSGFGTMPALQILDLSGNKLEGELSPALADLTALQYLALDNNAFRGTLPDGFAPTLSEIHLEHNYLRGTVPTTLKACFDAGASVYLDNNYMTGTDLKAMDNNGGNFTDGASTAQYRLAANRTTVQISEDGRLNLYALLENRGGAAKAMLNVDEYAVLYDAAKVEITSDAKGIYVRALEEIPPAARLPVTIQIKDNDGSDYSKVTFIVTTDSVPTGGGGMAGSTEPEPAFHSAYISGFPGKRFAPAENITREQTAKMLIDALEIETDAGAAPTYSDVDTGRWSYAWVEAATREGYMKGYGKGVFKPDAQITRAEMAAMLVRISAKNGMILNDSTKSFSDVTDDKWYAGEVLQAVQYGLITGYSDGTFRPDQPITRAEAVVIVNRMLQRDYKTAAELHEMACPFSDVDETHWAYGDVMEAAISHNH